MEVIQTDKVENFKTSSDDKTITIIRASVQYIGLNTNPDVCAKVQLIVPKNDPTMATEHKLPFKTLQHLRESKYKFSVFMPLIMESALSAPITDAPFAN